jgi:hypothetical protein
MSVMIYPVFNKAIAEEFDCDGNGFGRYFDLLNELSDKNGVAPLSSFGNNSEIPEGFDGKPKDIMDRLEDTDI